MDEGIATTTRVIPVRGVSSLGFLDGIPPLTDGTPSKQVFHHGTNVQRGSKVSQQLSVNGDLAAT